MIFLYCLGSAGGQRATWKFYKNKSQTWSGCLAVSVVGKRSRRETSYRKRVIGTLEQYSCEDAARQAVVGLVSEINSSHAFYAHDRRSALRPFRATRVGVRQYLAQLCDQEGLSNLSETMDRSALGEIRAFTNQDDRSRVLASSSATGEK